jgi:outer membrane protein OmpA-like peptidoglycan-associated protein
MAFSDTYILGMHMNVGKKLYLKEKVEMKKFALIFCILTLVPCCALDTKTQKGGAYGAAGGAAAGAIVGQIIGGDTEATLIGAAIGAAVGGGAGAAVGQMMDKQEAEMQQALAESEAAAVRREGDLLAITFKSDFLFATDSAEVNPGLMPEIQRVSQVMVNYPQTVMRVEGRTDSTGSDEYNMKLGQRRAEAVQSLLVQNGVPRNRTEIVSFGEGQPIADNSTAQGRQLNRRVEIKIAPM